LTAAATLDRESITAVDQGRLLDDILALPDHLRDALWRVEAANLKPHDATGGLIVAGMGGSAIGGALARAALGDRALRPIVITRGYGLPPWTAPESTVLCSSYSGNTEETLAAYEAAGAVGAHRIVATTGGKLAAAARGDGVPVIPLPGGFQPRAAVGYSLVVALEVAGLAGAGEPLHSEIDVAAARTEELVANWGPGGAQEEFPKELARGLHGTVPQIAGSGLTSPIAYRWKCQFNENAKLPAFSSELPELDHNEIVGWQSPPYPPAHRADERPDRRRRRRDLPGRECGLDCDRAAALAGPVGRPGVALSRRAARRRSGPRGRARPPQERARRRLAEGVSVYPRPVAYRGDCPARERLARAESGRCVLAAAATATRISLVQMSVRCV
jgi:glucose/mannose-6-phosphate isomerase